jgi:hypothetical protein
MKTERRRWKQQTGLWEMEKKEKGRVGGMVSVM